jgi:hypothetical protein
MDTPKEAFMAALHNREPRSQIIDRSRLHPTKHSEPKISTDAGIMISIKPVPPNAAFSIRDNLDPDSNVTEESNLHS